jgi:hypothetical protein
MILIKVMKRLSASPQTIDDLIFGVKTSRMYLQVTSKFVQFEEFR